MNYGSYVHVHVSEREAAHRWPDGRWDDARWEDCLWCSAVEALRFIGIDAPATHAEAEALRADAGKGPTGGSNHDDLARGVKARYGVELSRGIGITALRTVLLPGTAAVVNGLMGAFPPGHRLRRHDPTFDAGHTVAAFNIGRGDVVWWCDPLGPAGYEGEWVTWADLAAFMNGLDGRFTWARRGAGEMWELKTKYEEWRPAVDDKGVSRGVLRAMPDRAAPIVVRVPVGEVVLSTMEVDTYPGARVANDDWRLVPYKGRDLYALRHPDWVPVVQGGDLELNERVKAAVQNRGAGDCDAAIAEATAKGKATGAAAALNEAAELAGPAIVAVIDRVAAKYTGGVK